MRTLQAIEALGALAHEHRLAVYRLLVERGPEGLAAGAIAERIGLVPSSLTFHLQNLRRAGLIGAVQGLCLPFRGFSRSGATISTGMLRGMSKARAEAFSFALAVVLTPAVLARDALRLRRLSLAPSAILRGGIARRQRGA